MLYQDFSGLINKTLVSGKIFDFFSVQEKQRMVELFYSSINEFQQDHDIESFTDIDTWNEELKVFLVNQLDESEGIFGVKGLSKKLNLDEFLKEYFKQEFLSE